MDNNLLKLVWKCFQTINAKEQNALDDELKTNKQVATKIIDTLTTADNVRASLSNPDQQREVHQLFTTALINDRRIAARAENLDMNSLSDQMEGLDINHEDVKSKSETVKNWHHIAGNLDRPLGPRSVSISTWLKANDFILRRNKNLTDQQVRKVEEEMEIKRQRSLLDDYADPSLEQPSYMDPDD